MLRFEDLKTQRATGGLQFLEVDMEIALNILYTVREKGNQDNVNDEIDLATDLLSYYSA